MHSSNIKRIIVWIINSISKLCELFKKIYLLIMFGLECIYMESEKLIGHLHLERIFVLKQVSFWNTRRVCRVNGIVDWMWILFKCGRHLALIRVLSYGIIYLMIYIYILIDWMVSCIAYVFSFEKGRQWDLIFS